MAKDVPSHPAHPETQRDERTTGTLAPVPLVAFLGDAIAIVAGLVFAYSTRFKSSWVRLVIEVLASRNLEGAVRVFNLGWASPSALPFQVSTQREPRHGSLRLRRLVVVTVRRILVSLANHPDIGPAGILTLSTSRVQAGSSRQSSRDLYNASSGIPVG